MLRFAVLGTGKVVRERFSPAVRASGEAVVSVIGSRRPEAVDTRVLGIDHPVRVVPFEQALDPALADAVYIALPNEMHVPWTLKAAQAGLHVLCEKPLTRHRALADECQRVCAKRGVLLAEAFMYRHDPRHERVRQLVAAGAIGRVHLIEATFSYVLEDLENIRLSLVHDGGALLDVGCYGIDVSRLLTGEEPRCVLASRILGDRTGVDEVVAVVLQFSSGVLATVTASTHLARTNAYRVRGTAGSIDVPSAFVPRPDEPTAVVIHRSGAEPQREGFTPMDPFVMEIRRFAHAVAGAQPELWSPGEDGHANARVLEAAWLSMGLGRVVELVGDST